MSDEREAEDHEWRIGEGKTGEDSARQRMESNGRVSRGVRYELRGEEGEDECRQLILLQTGSVSGDIEESYGGNGVETFNIREGKG